jgi:hypothetical protein
MKGGLSPLSGQLSAFLALTGTGESGPLLYDGAMGTVAKGGTGADLVEWNAYAAKP